MYQSPIEVIYKEMRTEFENNVYKAIQDYGVCVDKDELIKALQYDRGQYEKGYADGIREAKSEWISVDERLPETSGACIVCRFDGYVYKTFFSGTFPKAITHWMPLPEPPMMKGGAE